jgi:hypothetical protein
MFDPTPRNVHAVSAHAPLRPLQKISGGTILTNFSLSKHARIKGDMSDLTAMADAPA